MLRPGSRVTYEPTYLPTYLRTYVPSAGNYVRSEITLESFAWLPRNVPLLDVDEPTTPQVMLSRP